MNRSEFITITSNWDSYKPLLWESLEVTRDLGLPVLELGCGNGSTPILRKYCKDNKLKLFSYDNDKSWAEKFNANYVPDWEVKSFWHMDFGVALIDHAPGEHRKLAISRLRHVRILVAHDTEPAADHGYRMRSELVKFRYMKDYQTDGAWATAVSDYVDVSKFKL